MNIPKLPLEEIIEQGISWVHLHLEAPFSVLIIFIGTIQSSLQEGILFVPPMVIILLLFALALWRIDFRTAIIIGMALLLIWDLRIWKEAMETLSLVLVAAGFSLFFGIPIGILLAESRMARGIVTPILDYMQTTPSFVYLIPAVLFFGLGAVPGIMATAMFATPPPVRLTALGLTQIDQEVIEAGEAFGCNRWKLLCKIKFPLAIPSIMLGINQCIMMSLSMVVITSMIGVRGLGMEIIRSLSRMDMAKGIEAGVAVVLIAVVLDRLSSGAIQVTAPKEWL